MSPRAALAEALGIPAERLRFEPLGGGCINQAARVRGAGEPLFVKWNQHSLPGQFEAEARGLKAMADSGTSLTIPRPRAWSDAPGSSFLALEFLSSGRRGPDFDEALGRGLAELHRATSPRGFGFEVDGACGATPQPNGWLDDWARFYGERRLGHQLRLAARRGFSREGLALGERVLCRLPELLGDPEPPALIHGDLWSGNLHVTGAGAPALVDPAAYYGHREAELGMMVLFGGFGPRVFAAYDEAFPLQPGWRDRLDLYSLYHVLNHYNLFGGGYEAQAVRLLRRYA